MQFGILGLPKVGKTTLFNTLTASHEATGKFESAGQTHVGVARVPDDRLARAARPVQAEEVHPGDGRVHDIPGISAGEGAESLDLAKLKTVDALLHVVRAFEDPEIPHAGGSARSARRHRDPRPRADPRRPLAGRAAARAARQGGQARPDAAGDPREEAARRDHPAGAREPRRRCAGSALAARRRAACCAASSSSRPSRCWWWSTSPRARSRSAKPEDFGARTSRAGLQGVVVSAPIELEISRLSAEEQKEFLADLGLAEPSLDRVIRASYGMLGVIAFFTVGEDEVRAWTIRRGTMAREAAGAIHSDIERGFIRAEVVRWDDLLKLGSLAHCREKALLRLEGKEYVVARRRRRPLPLQRLRASVTPAPRLLPLLLTAARGRAAGRRRRARTSPSSDGWRIERVDRAEKLAAGATVTIENRHGDLRVRVGDPASWRSTAWRSTPTGNRRCAWSSWRPTAAGRCAWSSRRAGLSPRIRAAALDLAVAVPADAPLVLRAARGTDRGARIPRRAARRSAAGEIRLRGSGAVDLRSERGAVRVAFHPEAPRAPSRIETSHRRHRGRAAARRRRGGPARDPGPADHRLQPRRRACRAALQEGRRALGAAAPGSSCYSRTGDLRLLERLAAQPAVGR